MTFQINYRYRTPQRWAHLQDTAPWRTLDEAIDQAAYSLRDARDRHTPVGLCWISPYGEPEQALHLIDLGPSGAPVIREVSPLDRELVATNLYGSHQASF